MSPPTFEYLLAAAGFGPIAAGLTLLGARWLGASVRAVGLSGALVAAALCAGAAAGMRFRWAVGNLAFVALLYGLGWLGLLCCWATGSRPLRAIIAASVVSVAALLWWNGPVALFIVYLIAGEQIQEPFETHRLPDGHVCRLTAWGLAGTDSGYDIGIYVEVPLLPFLERKVAGIRVSQENPAAGTEDLTCAAFAARLAGGR